jgi:hypothetical protein
MNFFTKILHFLEQKDKELLGINNVAKAYHAWKRWRSRSNTTEEHPLKIARSPHGSDFPNPPKIAQTPVQPLSEMKVARTPGKVEVLPPPAQVLPIQISPPTQNPTPTHVIDVQPEKQVNIAKEPADQGKNFF